VAAFFGSVTTMSSYKELPEYAANHGYWRAAANEIMKHLDDFPASLLTLPELYDGSISHGCASMIRTIIRLPPAGSPPGTLGILIVEDNGVGIHNDEALARLLSWASASSTTVHHRYGHGTKKMFAKWMPEYETAEWKVEYRAKSRRGGTHTNDLVEITGPFLGLKTPKNITDDNTSLNPSGMRWTIRFDPTILGNYKDASRLFSAVKEIIRTRYSRIPLAATTFELEVYEGDKLVQKEDSRNWKTLAEALEKEVTDGRARIIHGPVKVPMNGGHWEACEYLLADDKVLSKDFPTYGQRNMYSSRVHMGLDGRFIEAMSIFEMLNVSNHPNYNGRISIVNFVPNPEDPNNYDKLPTPATTKVAFSEICPIFQEFKTQYAKFLMSSTAPIVVSTEFKVEDIPNMSVPNLKALCEAKGLTKGGTKPILVERLINAHLTPDQKKARDAKKKEEDEKAALVAAEALAKRQAAAKKAAEEAAKKADEEKKRLAALAAAAAKEKAEKEKAAVAAAAVAAAEAVKRAEEERKVAAEAAAAAAEEAKGVGISLDGTHMKKYKTFPAGKTIQDLLSLLDIFFSR